MSILSTSKRRLGTAYAICKSGCLNTSDPVVEIVHYNTTSIPEWIASQLKFNNQLVATSCLYSRWREPKKKISNVGGKLCSQANTFCSTSTQSWIAHYQLNLVQNKQLKICTCNLVHLTLISFSRNFFTQVYTSYFVANYLSLT